MLYFGTVVVCSEIFDDFIYFLYPNLTVVISTEVKLLKMYVITELLATKVRQIFRKPCFVANIYSALYFKILKHYAMYAFLRKLRIFFPVNISLFYATLEGTKFE